MMWPWWWPWRLLFQSLCSCDLHSQNVFGTWKKRGKEIQMEYIQYVTDVYIYTYIYIYPEIFQIPTNLKKLPMYTLRESHTSTGETSVETPPALRNSLARNV